MGRRQCVAASLTSARLRSSSRERGSSSLALSGGVEEKRQRLHGRVEGQGEHAEEGGDEDVSVLEHASIFPVTFPSRTSVTHFEAVSSLMM